jgi:hypothetical protein
MLERFWKNNAPTPPMARILHLSCLPTPSSFDSLVSLAQRYFLRPKGKERFELRDTFSQFFHRRAFHKEFHALGLIEPIYPSFSEYASILLLGTSYFDMIERIRFFLSLDVKAAHIFFLTGKRPLAKWEIKALKVFIPPFEDFMVQELAKRLPPSFSYSFVISTMKGKERPTTKDTFLDWLRQNPPFERTLLISNQPYGEYQRLIASSLSPIKFDIAASLPCEKKETVAIYLDTIARTLYLISQTMK